MNMRRMILLLSLLLAFTVAAAETADQIAARFNKTKHKTGSKHGVSKALFLEIKARPLVRRDPATWSGQYAGDFGWTLALQVRPDGTATGSGTDGARFTLRNARVSGALLTGTKVYAGGTTAPLRAAFLERSMREGTSAGRITSSDTATGIGIVDVDVVIDGGIHIERLFLEAQ
jgi:hypothetical protein